MAQSDDVMQLLKTQQKLHESLVQGQASLPVKIKDMKETHMNKLSTAPDGQTRSGTSGQLQSSQARTPSFAQSASGQQEQLTPVPAALQNKRRKKHKPEIPCWQCIIRI